jgi:hypothetical protein
MTQGAGLRFRVGKNRDTGDVAVEIKIDSGSLSGDTFSFQLSQQKATEWAHALLSMVDKSEE